MALANIGLDLLGQARVLLTRVGELDGTGRPRTTSPTSATSVSTATSTSSSRSAATSVSRWPACCGSRPTSASCMPRCAVLSGRDLAGVAAKALKEVTYHQDHAAQWWSGSVTAPRSRTAGCTTRSMPSSPTSPSSSRTTRRSSAAAEAGVGVLPSSLGEAVSARVAAVVEEATLSLPEPSRWRSRGGRDGIHSRPMGYLLAEMQHIARSHPGATW